MSNARAFVPVEGAAELLAAVIEAAAGGELEALGAPDRERERPREVGP